jgi:hypothetical protein
MQAWSIDSAGHVMVDGDTTGTICTGVLKLAQRFMITFLNEVGSIKYNYWGRDIEQGSRFMLALRQGWMHTEADVYAEFAMAELQTRSQLQAEETGSEPDDERYSRSELRGVTITNGTVTLTINLYSKSDSVQIILPIPIMVTS